MKVPAKTTEEQPRQNSGSGGTGSASGGNDPTDVNWKSTVQASPPFVATIAGVPYHLQNVALLQWYNQVASPTSLNRAYSFPDASALPEAARPAPAGRRGGGAFGLARDHGGGRRRQAGALGAQGQPGATTGGRTGTS
jgi:hypothetical protein